MSFVLVLVIGVSNYRVAIIVLNLELLMVVVISIEKNTISLAVFTSFTFFSDEDFLHITIINSVLCFVLGRTDSAYPTERLLIVILGGQVKTN